MCVARAQAGGRNPESAGSPADVTIYLPSAHPAYATVERLRAAGFLAGTWLNVRPLSRLAVARALLEGGRLAREQGLTALADAAAWRLREFGRDLGPDGIEVEPAATLAALHWEGAHQTSITAEPTVEFAWDGREDIPPDHRSAFIARWGFELYGTAGRGVGYAARYRESAETRKGTVRQWPWFPGQTVHHSFGGFGGRIAYSQSNSHVSWDGSVFGADLRFGSPVWGPSPGSNLILSGHVPAFGHAQLRLAFGEWLRYTMLTGSLASGLTDSLRSYSPDEGAVYRDLKRQKYLIGHRIDLQLLPRLTIGLTETVIAGDRFPDLVYFVPTASLWDSQHYLTDPDNVMVALDASWTLPGGPRLYGTFGIDEWRLENTFADNSRNWLAFQLGGSWTLPVDDGRWHLWLEATRVHPNVYRHKFPVNDWTHADSGLGFWSGQNSEVLEGHLIYHVDPRLSIAAWGRYARKGGEGSRIQQYDDTTAERFMDGADRLGAWIGGRLTFEGQRHWRIIAEVVRAPRMLWPHDSPPAAPGQEWQIALRWAYNPF
jgi:hypothetical protein